MKAKQLFAAPAVKIPTAIKPKQSISSMANTTMKKTMVVNPAPSVGRFPAIKKGI